MKKIIMALFFASASVAAQTGCTTGSGVTCSSNLNLWLLPQHYQNWGVPWNANATAIDAFSLTVPLFNPTATQTIAQPSGTYFNVNNLFVYGTPAVIRFALTPGTQDGSLSRTGAGTFSLDSSVAGNGLGILALGGIKVGGSGGTVGQGLCSDGTTYSVACTSTISYYQTVSSNGTAITQRPTLNFTSEFTATDSASPAETTVDLANTTVTPGSYTSANITVNAKGQITAAANGGGTSNACSSYISTTTAGCTTTAGGKWIEWGNNSAVASTSTTFTLPVSFPTACLFAIVSNDTNIYGYQKTMGADCGSISTVTVYNGNSSALNAHWMVIGN